MHRLLNDRYRVMKPIARGGMAEVWEGYDERLSRPVAVKILKAHLAADTSFLERFRREAITAARLAHPNVVATFDTGVDHRTNPPRPDVAYIVMELVRGETLRQLLRRQGPLPAPLAVAIATQITDALAHAHRAGLVHRDIKPANVLVAEDGWDDTPQVKVTDFGIAKVTEGMGLDLTRTGMVLGTPKYLSPEQIQGEEPDARADLYALGVVLFEMLAGKPPFAESTEMATALAHLNNPPPDLHELRPDLPPSLIEVVQALLAKNPVDRVPSAVALRRRLNQVGRVLGSPAIPNPNPDDTNGTSWLDSNNRGDGQVPEGWPEPPAAPSPANSQTGSNGSTAPEHRTPTRPDGRAATRPVTRTAIAPRGSADESRVGQVGPARPPHAPFPLPPKRVAETRTARAHRTGRTLSVIVGILLVAAVIVVALLLANPRRPTTPAANTGTGTHHHFSGGSPPVSAKTIPIVNVTEVIAPGHSLDNPGALPYAYDNNTSTAWESDHYQSPNWGGYYSGLGLAIHLNANVTCDTLTVTSVTQDWSAQVFVSSHNSPSVSGWGSAIASRTGINDSATFSLGHRQGTWVLLWLTSTGNTNGAYQMSVSNLSVTGTP